MLCTNFKRKIKIRQAFIKSLYLFPCLMTFVNGLQNTARAFGITDYSIGNGHIFKYIFQSILRLGAHGCYNHGRVLYLFSIHLSIAHSATFNAQHFGAKEQPAAGTLDALVQPVSMCGKLAHGWKSL